MGHVTKTGETSLVITGCVLSYPHLFEPRAAAPGSEPKFSANLILPDFDEADNTIIVEMVNKVVAERWPQGAPKDLQAPWRVVDEKTPEYEGRNCINAGASVKSWDVRNVVIEDGKTQATPGDVFAGMGVNVHLGVFSYAPSKDRPMIKNGWGFGLNAIQIADRTLPSLGGRLMPENVFTPVAAPAAAMPGAAPVGAPTAAVPQAPVAVPGAPPTTNPLT